jgi:predicted  nucleic acid-binding Zn-ribbon protein
MRRDIKKFEDQQIVLMEEEDAAHSWVKTQEKSMKETESGLLAQIKALENEAASKDSLIADEMKKREEQVKETDPVWYLRYEKIRKNKGMAMAPIIESKNGNGVCGGCKFEVRPQHIIELKKGNSIKTCENCARLMYVEVKEGTAK